MQLEQPRIRDVLHLGGLARDWERIFDEAPLFRYDDAVLRAVECAGRRPPGLIRRPNARGGNVQSLAAQFRSGFSKDIGGVTGASDVWLDADFVAVDGGTGKTQSIVDYIDNTHLLTQLSSPSQSVVPATDASFASAKSFTFSGAQYYTSSRNKTLFQCFHDASDFEIYTVLVPIAGSEYWSTRSSGTPGAACSWGSGGGGTFTNSAARTGANFIIEAALAPSGTATYFDSNKSSGASPQHTLRQRSTIAASGAFTGAAGTGDSETTLVIGGAAGGTFLGSMRLRAIYQFRSVNSAARRAINQAWIQKDTGLTP